MPDTTDTDNPRIATMLESSRTLAAAAFVVSAVGPAAFAAPAELPAAIRNLGWAPSGA